MVCDPRVGKIKPEKFRDLCEAAGVQWCEILTDIYGNALDGLTVKPIENPCPDPNHIGTLMMIVEQIEEDTGLVISLIPRYVDESFTYEVEVYSDRGVLFGEVYVSRVEATRAAVVWCLEYMTKKKEKAEPLTPQDLGDFKRLQRAAPDRLESYHAKLVALIDQRIEEKT